MRIVAAALLVFCNSGCGVLGPSCLSRQHRGPVTTIAGEVGPGETAMHQVAYATEGSQNDIEVRWPGQFTASSARIRIYATKAGCHAFPPPPGRGSADCLPIASGGVLDNGVVVSTLIVTHGRGNPEVLGSPPAYKLWIVGDLVQSAPYTISVSYFYGPDC